MLWNQLINRIAKARTNLIALRETHCVYIVHVVETIENLKHPRFRQSMKY